MTTAPRAKSGVTNLAYHQKGQSLGDLIRGCASVSIIGMCKNAGKTTALNALLRGPGMSQQVLALTSIGRDGERVDLVTGTKKPGIYVAAGNLIATAEGLLHTCDITKEILWTTGVDTPLGEVVILRALSDGHVQLAGPSQVAQMVELSHRFRTLGAERIIIDGAVGRKTLCSRALAEATVLCTGASCGDDMDTVVRETAHTCQLLGTREADDPQLAQAVRSLGDNRYLLMGTETAPLAAGADLLEALRAHGPVRYLYVEGAVTDRLLYPLLRTGGFMQNITVVTRDASRLLLSADTLRRLHGRSWELRVLEAVHLAAVAVNPYSAHGHNFDGPAFLCAMANAVAVPVVNVEDGGGEML